MESACNYYRDDLYATAGATQGLDLLSHMLFSEGDLVFVEDPTYFVAMKIFEDSGKKVIRGKAKLTNNLLYRKA